MNSELLTIATIFASGGLLGYIVGSVRGHKRGRDEQWVEDFLTGDAREKLRRDKCGRFKPKTK
jgi:hypothetical protein